ncbi:MAG: metallophosphatase family protein [Candidatus Saccharibacteria bacterium]|nr:metallophosphatase family protein [Candidatus Saccharibacteria bacterium]
MRIGIISDVHSNIDALRAVFDEFTDRDVDKIICLGDIIGLGAHPEECVQFLKEHQSQLLAIVLGNHENYLLKEIPVYNHNDSSLEKLPQEIIDLFKWNHEQISHDSINFLRQLQRCQTVEVEGKKIFVSHYPLNQLGTYRKFYCRPNSAQCKQLFKDIDADIYLFGHTHIRCVAKSRDSKLYINPGSVGCPIGIEAASAGILNITDGNLNYEQIDVPYDVDHAIDDMLQHNDELPAIDYTVNRFYRTLND